MSQPSNMISPSDKEECETLDYDRERYLKLGFIHAGVPTDRTHARFLAEQNLARASRALTREPSLVPKTAYACVFSSSSNGAVISRYFEVLQDTGCVDNWISPLAIRAMQIPTHKRGTSEEHIDFQGGVVMRQEYADITFTGKDPTVLQSSRFWVADETAPFTLLVGRDWLNAKGFAMFLEKVPEGRALCPLVPSKLTDEEKRLREDRRVAADKKAADLQAARQRAIQLTYGGSQDVADPTGQK